MVVLLLLLLLLLAVDLEVETSRMPLLWTHTSSNSICVDDIISGCCCAVSLFLLVLLEQSWWSSSFSCIGIGWWNNRCRSHGIVCCHRINWKGSCVLWWCCGSGNLCVWSLKHFFWIAFAVIWFRFSCIIGCSSFVVAGSFVSPWNFVAIVFQGISSLVWDHFWFSIWIFSSWVVLVWFFSSWICFFSCFLIDSEWCSNISSRRWNGYRQMFLLGFVMVDDVDAIVDSSRWCCCESHFWRMLLKLRRCCAGSVLKFGASVMTKCWHFVQCNTGQSACVMPKSKKSDWFVANCWNCFQG